MSGTGLVYRAAGPTVGLSVVATSHAAVPIAVVANDNANFVALLNTGIVAMAVRLSVAGTAATLPGDGTTGDFVIPGAMTAPMVVPLPSPSSTTAGPCQITAIATAAGPSLLYVTPVVIQT